MGRVLTLRDTRPSGWSQDRWRWLNEVRQDGDLSAMARLVACSLGFGFANHKTGECCPGVQALARDVQASPRTIERCLFDLQARGWIVRLGGNAPGVRARFAFRFPEQHTPDLAGRHTPDPSETHANPDAPLMNKDSTMIEPKERQHPRAAIRGLPRPSCLTTMIARGSVTAGRWDAWLHSEGYPPLDRIGHRIDGQYEMPITVPADKFSKMPHGIALRWAEWLRSKA